MDRHMYSAVAPRLGQAEVMNSFSHNFVNRKLSMVEFYMRCESALAQQRQHEFPSTMSTSTSNASSRRNSSWKKSWVSTIPKQTSNHSKNYFHVELTVAHVRGLRVTVSDAVMYLFCCDHAMSMRCPIIIFYKMCHKATRSEDAFLFVAERLQRYESDLNEYLSASLSLGCGMSSVRSAKYADTIAIYPLKMSEAKGSARWIKGGKELAIER